jgi:DUF1365 family protein
VKSAIYEGTVVHHRFEPVDHRFDYRIALPLLYLDEIPAVARLHPLWSTHPSPVWLRRADLLGDRSVPVDQAVRDLVVARLGFRPAGPIAVLAQPRTWGWLFNPISIYFCFAADGVALDALVLEVSNTPWHERHCYVLAGSAGSYVFAKAMHVSPFLGMDHDYHLALKGPDQRLTIDLSNHQGGQRVFAARLTLARQEISRAALGRLLWAYPAQTLVVSGRIYRQAFALHRKGARYHPHPHNIEGASPLVTTGGAHG